MTIAIAATGSTVTITATGENLDFAKIKTALLTLSDTNNTVKGTVIHMNKELSLQGNGTLELGSELVLMFTGNVGFLIGSGFTSVGNGRVVNGSRVGKTVIRYTGLTSTANRHLINNTVPTYLDLDLSQDITCDYPRISLKNTHASSVLKLSVASLSRPIANPHIFLQGGWKGYNEVTFNNASYEPTYLDNWFNIVSAPSLDPKGTKTLAYTAYPSAGYKFAGDLGRFGFVNPATKLYGLPNDIGAGTTFYQIHPITNNRIISFAYDFTVDLVGASAVGATVGFISGSTVFKNVTLTANSQLIDDVVLLTGINTGGSTVYSPISSNLTNYKTGHTVIRHPTLIDIRVAYLKGANTPSFAVNSQTILDPHWSSTGSISVVDDLSQLYDEVKKIKCTVAGLGLPDDLLTVSGQNLVIKSGWSLARDQSGAAVVVDAGNSIIKVKTGASGMLVSSKFTTLVGTVAASFNTHTDALYVKANGKVDVVITGVNPEGFTLASTYPATVGWKLTSSSAYTLGAASHTLSNLTFEADPSTVLDIRLVAPGYLDRNFQINTGAYGVTKAAEIQAVVDLQGVTMFDKTTVAAQIAALMYDSTALKVKATNTTANLLVIDINSAFVALERIIKSPALALGWAAPLMLNGTKDGFVIPTGNPLAAFMSTNSTTAVQFSFDIKHPSGDNASDRFTSNANGIQLTAATTVFHPDIPIRDVLAPELAMIALISTAVSGKTLAEVSDIPIDTVIATAVRAEIAVELARIDGNITDGPDQAAINAGILGIPDATKAMFRDAASTILVGGSFQSFKQADRDMALAIQVVAKQILQMWDQKL